MSDLVDSDSIESIVGASRHVTDHLARADSTADTVYILHSRQCKDSGIDLRECPFSLALDKGIYDYIPWSGWRRVQDQPVRAEIFRGYLVPELSAVKAALEGRVSGAE